MKRSHSVAIIVLLCVLFAVFGAESLGSRISHDAPIVVYASYLIDQHDYTPYAGVFDMNLPGTYFIYMIGGRLLGYNDSAMRRFDLLLLGILLVITYALMRRFGKQVALVSALVFGVIHLGSGLYLQREFLMLIPITLGTLLSPAFSNGNSFPKALASGLLFGLATTIKPHAVIAAVPLVVFHITFSLRDKQDGALRDAVQKTATFCAGMVVPVAAMFVYLWQVGAVDSFIDMARNYWPLYGSYDGQGNQMFAWSRAEHLLKGARELGRNGIWLLPAGMAIYHSLFLSDMSNTLKRRVLVLATLALVFDLYPVLTGQFWHYHWLPFRFFIVLISSLCFLPMTASRFRPERLFFAAALLSAVVISIQPPRTMFSRLTGGSTAPKNGEVDTVASFLKERLNPGDKVQPLDWSGGAVHAMLISKAEVATPFIYDFYFYHHVSDPYIQKLRRRFMDSLKDSNPRFFVEVHTREKPWPRGDDTTREFAELREFMDSNYAIALELPNFRVYERQAAGTSLGRLE